MLYKENETVFLMIDIQEKFENVIFLMDEVIKNANILNRATELLDVPLLVTEQYPKGLGNTSKQVYLPNNTPIVEKTQFSACTEEVIELLRNYERANIIVYGVEAHVCLLQTAIELKKNGFKVGIVADAVSSRHVDNKLYALTRLESLGFEIVTTEMILFELMKDSKHPKFREVSKLIK